VRAITPESLTSTKRPLILYFDSLNPLEKNLATLIRKYLEMEFADKKPAIFKQITGMNTVNFQSNNSENPTDVDKVPIFYIFYFRVIKIKVINGLMT
jgi:hypothetical protein